jgi:hypothetical protein
MRECVVRRRNPPTVIASTIFSFLVDLFKKFLSSFISPFSINSYPLIIPSEKFRE